MPHGIINKTYSVTNLARDAAARYSPASVVAVEREVVVGDPNMYISTSYVERQNLSLRMTSRRFTRLTNGFSKNRYFQKTRDGKLMLRKMMGRHIPAQVTDREKQGFSAPDASWFKGESIGYVRRRLYNERARIYDYLDQKTARTLIDDHLEGRQNRRLLIWSLLNLEQFCEAYL